MSSGAIAAGLAPLGLRRRPRDLATLQAAASVGQMLLVERYAASLRPLPRCVGQVLLTAEDIVRRAHYRNARRTLERLLALGVVPIVNENDAVATEEIRFGDNDRLAALVAHLVGADALVLLSDVDGVYASDPRKAGPRAWSPDEVRGDEDLAGVGARRRRRGQSAPVGWPPRSTPPASPTGAGVPVVVAAADAPRRSSRASEVGTVFHAAGRRTGARLLWLAHASSRAAGSSSTTAPCGRGAAAAVAAPGRAHRRRRRLRRRRPGRPVGPDGAVVARGLVGYDAAELPSMLGRSTARWAPSYIRREVVHRDDLVLL